MASGVNNPAPDYMTLQDALKLSQSADLNLDKVNIVTSFSASKQSIITDSELISPKAINTLVYVEFLELICRLTLQKFQGSELECLQLSQKLNFTLVEFLKYAGEKFKQPEEDYEKPFPDKDDEETVEEIVDDAPLTAVVNSDLTD